MSSHTTSTIHRSRTKLKTVKNQPSLGTFIDECQKAGILLKELSKLADGMRSSNNKRQHQPTGDTIPPAVNKKKPTSNPCAEPIGKSTIPEDSIKQICIKMTEMNLLQELKNMEQRITATLKSDKENEYKSMEERLTNNLKESINKSMKDAIQTLTSLNSNLVSSNLIVQKNISEVKTLKAENARLTKQVQVLSSE